MFDGPVDAIWIESMNTVLDDNKKLCLNSGQILTLTPHMTMMFEVEDLEVASPATVSRCGMVYIEPLALGLQPLIDSWLYQLPSNIVTKQKTTVENLRRWFAVYIDKALDYTRKNCREVIPTMNNNLCQSLQRNIDCLIAPFMETELRKVASEDLELLAVSCEYIFHFAFVWSILATVDYDGRVKLDKFHRDRMREMNTEISFPDEGSIYDYQYSFNQKSFISWSENYSSFEIDPKLGYHEIVIPTNDSSRNIFLMKLLLTHNHHVLGPGPTGTGKSQNAYSLLISQMPEEYQYIALTFSA